MTPSRLAALATLVWMLGCVPPFPQDVDPAFLLADEVAVGGWHVCVRQGPRVRCWGSNRSGQLANGRPLGANRYQEVRGLPDGARDVVAGGFHACARVEDTAWCWGRGVEGQLDGVAQQSAGARRWRSGVTRLAAGGFVSCAAQGNTVECVGENAGAKRTFPGTVEQLCAGWDHACALVEGRAWCWRNGVEGPPGSLGARLSTEAVPLDVPGPLQQLACGSYHACVAGPAGTYCLGLDDQHQLGAPAVSPAAAQVPLPGVPTALALGRGHSCALVAGVPWCWGTNSSGQAGPESDEPQLDRPTPVRVLKGVDHISAGVLQTCILKEGHHSCFGPLGNGM